MPKSRNQKGRSRIPGSNLQQRTNSKQREQVGTFNANLAPEQNEQSISAVLRMINSNSRLISSTTKGQLLLLMILSAQAISAKEEIETRTRQLDRSKKTPEDTVAKKSHTTPEQFSATTSQPVLPTKQPQKIDLTKISRDGNYYEQIMADLAKHSDLAGLLHTYLTNNEAQKIEYLKTKFDREELRKLALKEDNMGNNPIHLAAFRGSSDVIKFFKDSFGKEWLNKAASEKNNDGVNAIHLAVYQGHLGVIKYFEDLFGQEWLKTAASKTNKADYNAIHMAAHQDQLGVIEYLSSLDKEWLKTDALKTDKEDNNAIHIAAYQGHLGVIKYFKDSLGEEWLNKAALKTNKEGINAIHIAGYQGHLDVIKYFKDSLGEEWLNKAASEKNNNGNNAIHLAATQGHLDVIKYFKDSFDEEWLKKNALKKDDNGNNTIHFAAHQGHSNVIKYFEDSFGKEWLKTAALKTNKQGNNAVQLAASQGRLDVIKYFKDSLGEEWLKKAALEKNNNVGNAIHFAATEGHSDVIKYFKDSFGEEWLKKAALENAKNEETSESDDKTHSESKSSDSSTSIISLLTAGAAIIGGGWLYRKKVLKEKEEKEKKEKEQREKETLEKLQKSISGEIEKIRNYGQNLSESLTQKKINLRNFEEPNRKTKTAIADKIATKETLFKEKSELELELKKISPNKGKIKEYRSSITSSLGKIVGASSIFDGEFFKEKKVEDFFISADEFKNLSKSNQPLKKSDFFKGDDNSWKELAENIETELKKIEKELSLKDAEITKFDKEIGADESKKEEIEKILKTLENFSSQIASELSERKLIEKGFEDFVRKIEEKFESNSNNFEHISSQTTTVRQQQIGDDRINHNTVNKSPTFAAAQIDSAPDPETTERPRPSLAAKTKASPLSKEPKIPQDEVKTVKDFLNQFVESGKEIFAAIDSEKSELEKNLKDIINNSAFDDSSKKSLHQNLLNLRVQPIGREGKSQGHKLLRDLSDFENDEINKTVYYAFFGVLLQDAESISGRHIGESHFASLGGRRLQTVQILQDFLLEKGITTSVMAKFLLEQNSPEINDRIGKKLQESDLSDIDLNQTLSDLRKSEKTNLAKKTARTPETEYIEEYLEAKLEIVKDFLITLLDGKSREKFCGYQENLEPEKRLGMIIDNSLKEEKKSPIFFLSIDIYAEQNLSEHQQEISELTIHDFKKDSDKSIVTAAKIIEEYNERIKPSKNPAPNISLSLSKPQDGRKR